MKTKILLLTLFSILASSFSLIGQQKRIEGSVTDEDGLPLIAANIVIVETDEGMVTDFNGKYSLMAEEGQTLRFSYVGYQSKEMVIGEETTINVVLEEGNELNEVVITAQNISRDKKALPYAVENIDAKDLAVSGQDNLVNAMQGKATGVQITSSGGGPGQSSRIIIRGINSLDPGANNQPLFIVDGVPIDNSTYTVGGGASRNMSNRVGDINPDNIESMSILKGGAATALYGVRAANGAVIITTKKGQEGKLTVDFTSTYGIEEINKYPETQRKYTQGYLGDYDPNSFWPTWGPSIEEAKSMDPSHPDELFNNYINGYQKGNKWRNTLAMGAGTDKSNFRLSLSNLDHVGVLPFSNYGNLSARFNGSIQATEKVKIDAGISYINSGGDRVNADRYNESLTYWSPRVDVKDFEFENGTMKGYRNDGAVGNNPTYGAKTNKLTDDVDRYIGNFNVNYQVTDWFSINYRLGLDQYSDFRYRRAPGPTGIEGENVHEDNGLGFIDETRMRNRDINSNLMLNFNHEFSDKLQANVLLGHDLLDQSYNRVSTSGEELSVWNWLSINNVNPETLASSTYLSQKRLVGAFGEISIDYDRALYLTITGRNDWSSTLPVENRSFFYPSFSLGYVFTEHFEPFQGFFDFGKVRLSYAEIGKDTDPYRTNVTYGTDNIGAFSRQDTKGSLTLSPERTSTFEAGLELMAMGNRVGLDFTYYNHVSEDQIVPVPTSETTGFTTFILNAGSIENQGVEIGLDVTPIKTNNFNWDLRFNYTSNKNKVLEIIEGVDQIFLGSHYGYAGATASLNLVPGEAYGNIYGTSYARYNPNPSDPKFIDEDAPILIGEDGFPERNSDQLILGNTQPKWFGSLSTTFTWKDLTLTALFDTRQGIQKYNQMDNFFAAFGIAPYTLDREDMVVFDGVLADGSPNTMEVFKGQGVGPDGVDYGAGFYRNVYRGVTENFVEDADWVRLRNLSLSYQLPMKWFETIPMKGARVSFVGNNLWLSTPFSGYDPESNRANGNGDDGFGGFTYPAVKSYNFSINVSF